MRKKSTDEQSPAFQFYANDWISEPSRLKMSLEEQGAYILLYCHCWRGFKIPKDFEILSKMCNCTLDKIKYMWPSIKHMFKEIDDGQNLVCLQAEEERKEQALNRKKRQIAGKKGADKRWGKDEVQSK